MVNRAGDPNRAFWGDTDDLEAHRRYRTLVTAIDDGITVVGAAGELTFANERAEELLGRSREELAEFTSEVSQLDLVDETGERLEKDDSPFDRVIDREEPIYDQIIGLRRPSGDRVWLSVNGAPQWSEDDELDGAVFVLEDITEQRGVESELEKSLGRVSDAFYALDREFRFTHVNERAAELLRHSEEELLGECLWDVFPSAAEIDEVWDAFHTARDTQEATSYELYYDRLDFWVEANLYPSETGISVYFLDVTERKEREAERDEMIEELRESEERLRLALEAGEMGAWELDLRTGDSPIRSPQHDRIFGYEEPLEDWDFATFLGHVHPDDRERVERNFENALETGTWEFECRITRADGERRVIAAQGDFYFDSEGEPVRAAGVVQDVTEREERVRELQRTERRFEAIFEDSNILVGLLEPDGTVLDINETAMEYIDADLEAVTGEPFWETPWWGEGDGVQRDVEEWTKRAAAGEYVDFEVDLTRLDGRQYTLEGVFRPVTNDDGDVVSIVVSDRDVTERREYERQLEQSERRYRTLAECFPNGIVTLFDDDLRYTLAEGRSFDELPISANEVEGKTVREVWGNDGADVLEPAMEAALDGEEETVEGSGFGREWVVHVVPISDESGTVFSGMTMAQDITERTERERALAESERRYRTLVEHFPNGAVGLFDENLRYTAIGGELVEAVGISPEDRIGSSLYDIYPDELVEEIEPHFVATLEGDAHSFEVRHHNRYLLATTVPVRNADDEIFAGMLVVQDVTDRTEYQRQLEKSNERLEQFAYAASHDLQEPLRMVSSYLRLLERRYEDALDEDGEEFLEFAIDGADRMRKMIEGLLQYSRVDSKGSPPEPVELDAVLEDVLADLQLQIEEADADVAAELLPRVDGDANQLRQLFQNLVDNALTYSGDDPPRIDISAERTGQEWVVSISDEGVGIEPDEQEMIFEVFQRLHSREEHPGTGIGLALCERIVDRHGGEIWVDAEPGTGSTFSFTLPATDDRDERADETRRTDGRVGRRRYFW